MILLHKDDSPKITVNYDMIEDYKRECDVRLINIKRELSRRLNDYTVFVKYNRLCNSFYTIIESLYNRKYESFDEVKTDYNKMVSDCKDFLKMCESFTAQSTFIKVSDEIELYKNTMQKLYKIIETNHMLIKKESN